MARSQITSATNDLVSDTGAILLSLVRGEQVEYPCKLDFLVKANAGYVYEAVVVEASNLVDGTKPTTIQPSGIQNTLVVRTLTDRGAWSAVATYQREEYVLYTDGKYYRLIEQTDYVSATPPSMDDNWEEYSPDTVFVQFPDDLSLDWATNPTAEFPIYGFFELRVTEPDSVYFKRTWKPVRGLIEFLFSPTAIVADV